MYLWCCTVLYYLGQRFGHIPVSLHANVFLMLYGTSRYCTIRDRDLDEYRYDNMLMYLWCCTVLYGFSSCCIDFFVRFGWMTVFVAAWVKSLCTMTSKKVIVHRKPGYLAVTTRVFRKWNSSTKYCTGTRYVATRGGTEIWMNTIKKDKKWKRSSPSKSIPLHMLLVIKN